jgi:hypothetical protein
MVEAHLTKEMIDAGAALVRKLDERGIQPDAAFWLYFPDMQTWKLVIAQVKVGSEGPKQMYRQIQELMEEFSQQIQELSLDDVTLSKPDAPIISLLRMAIHTGPGVSGIRFKNNVINGTVIEDAFIYRLN